MRFLPLLSLALLAGACTLGPNYAGPPAAPAGVAAGGGFVRAGELSAAAPPAAQWWRGLNDPVLDALEAQAMAGNPGVDVARARLRQARAALRLERANQLPSVAATAMYAHAEIPGIDLGALSGGEQPGGEQGGGTGGQPQAGGAEEISSLDLYNLGLSASWEIDLFGGQRRTVEASRATLAAAELNVADVQVQLSADVATAYVNLRDRQQRLILAERSSEVQRRMLALTEQRFRAGTTSQLDVERVRTLLENTDAQRVPLRAEIAAYQNALAVLTGQAPGAVDATLAAPMATPLPPAEVAIGDPAALLQRRPDIRAAERRLAAQTARIGVAEASRFPRLSFMGILGLGGTRPSALTDLDNLTALALPQLQWAFLDFGRGAARVRQAEGVRDEAEAQYRQAVLRALQDAEDALARFGARRQTVASLARVKASADRAAALTEQRSRAGTTTLIDWLDAERQRIAAEQNLAAAAAALTIDFVALQKALGLGWAPSAAAEGMTGQASGGAN
jgi:NodT family efflux transporter outer membrane factor (OMF) lipoprotein